MTSNAATVSGTVSGGPLDGQTFTLPGTADIRGASINFGLGDACHGYDLVSTDEGNVLLYIGTATPEGHICTEHEQHPI